MGISDKSASAGAPAPAKSAEPKAAPQSVAPGSRSDAEPVTPETLEPVEVYAPPAAGTDPDSLERVAKQLVANPGNDSNDHAEDLRRQAAKDREATLERDSKPQQRSAGQKSES